MRKLNMLWIAVLCCLLCVSAFAAEAPDLNALGSISLTMETESGPVPNGSVALYHVAEIHEDDGQLSFVYTDAFDGCSYSLDIQPVSQELSEQILSFAVDRDLPYTVYSVDSRGQVQISDIPAGLYLLFQNEDHAAEGYLPMKPFLISVPMEDAEGGWDYDVDGTPKLSLGTHDGPDRPEDSPAPTPTGPTTPGPKPTPGPSGGREPIPDTGQTNWPIPVLAICGLMLFALGWYICFSGRNENHEA